MAQLPVDEVRTRARSAVQPKSRRRRSASPLAIATVAFLLVYYGVFFVVPFGTAIWLSFQNWDFIVEPKFGGIGNYERALNDRYFWQALLVTIFFTVGQIVIGLSLALLLALFLSRLKGFSQRFVLALYYLPVVVPSVVSVLLWRWLYLPNGGALNTLLSYFGMPEQPFLNSAQQALWCIIAMVVWANLGIGIVLFLAGIQAIPESLFEAAKLDGAGLWRQFWYVILPLLRPVIVYQIVVSVIATVQMFEQFYLMSGPGFSTRTLALYTYQLGFQSIDLGYGATVSILIFLLLLVATVVQLRRFRTTWKY
jgi:multiple sugar transport system permease protein